MAGTADNTYRGKCFCGAIEVAVTGAPEAMGYCHCSDCRSWSAGPVNAFTLWKPDNVAVTKGAENLATFHKTENSYRQFCRICGGHLMTNHPGMGLVDVYAATIPDLPFEPQLHVFYGETVLRIRDGLPKMKDVPAQMGGSGDVLPE
ncbi:GFA family protein [Limobrevibacterium gyesilva]|uniref:GFA family protein n=1 Tax=Limobrevibacterium gyesilva TaxID=2991712 RepID=A0AA41YMZ2_9PROT|nr:GFA family protein [Limobrevibacterium gyesilva]MCW3473468.1 GFA family protein [Limobrevibacterium gyesilva]